MAKKVRVIQSLGDLRPDPKNARKHNPRNVGMIEKALGEVGAGRSIVIDEDGVVLAGNATIEAAAAAGIEAVRVVTSDGNEIVAVQRIGLSAAQKRKLALYDNRTAELAEWDTSVLAEFEMPDLADMWTEVELGDLLADVDGLGEEGNAESEVDLADEDGECYSRVGDLWKLGPHRVACGDSSDSATVEAALGGQSPRLMILDPPFDIEYSAWPLLGSVDVVAAWGRGDRRLRWEYEHAIPAGMGCHELVLVGGVRGQHNHTLPCCVHDVIHIWRRKWWEDKGEAIDRAVIRESGCEATVDERPMSVQQKCGGVLTGMMSWGKPVVAMEILTAYVPRGSVVWDPCAGSGSALIAADRHGRIYCGAENQPRWMDLILNRWTAESGADPVGIRDGAEVLWSDVSQAAAKSR